MLSIPNRCHRTADARPMSPMCCSTPRLCSPTCRQPLRAHHAIPRERLPGHHGQWAASSSLLEPGALWRSGLSPGHRHGETIAFNQRVTLTLRPGMPFGQEFCQHVEPDQRASGNYNYVPIDECHGERNRPETGCGRSAERAERSGGCRWRHRRVAGVKYTVTQIDSMGQLNESATLALALA